jgi:hypothetical protein
MTSEPTGTRWKLVAEFDEVGANEEMLLGEDAEFIGHVLTTWGGLPEEIMEDIAQEGTTITVVGDMLDPFMELIEWAGMHTVPKRLVLERQVPRHG